MRIYELFHSLVTRFAPMDKSTENDLQLEAVNYYNKIAFEAKEIAVKNEASAEYNRLNDETVGFVEKTMQPLKLKHRIIGYLESWYVRYIIALAYIYLVPKIKDFINGVSNVDGLEGSEEDEEQSEFDDFKEFQRYKKSML